MKTKIKGFSSLSSFFCLANRVLVREAIPQKKSQNCGLFPYGGGGRGAQSHSVAFGGVFPNITENILVDEISTKN